MSKNAQLNWDDVRYIVAVADHGSVAEAARVLSVNHATVLRRIAAFEDRQGVRLFEKSRRGYRVLTDRAGLIEAMREATGALGKVDQMIDVERPSLNSGVRVTSTDTFCQMVLGPMVAEASRDLGVPIDLISGNAHLDLGRSQADVAVRAAVSLPKDLDGEAVARFRFGLFGAKGGTDQLLGLSGPPARSVAGDWLRSQGAGAMISADSFTTLAGLAADGVGTAILPVFFGDTWPGLRRLAVLKDMPATSVWVASHVDYAKSGRLVRVRKHLSASLKAAEPVLMGQD